MSISCSPRYPPTSCQRELENREFMDESILNPFQCNLRGDYAREIATEPQTFNSLLVSNPLKDQVDISCSCLSERHPESKYFIRFQVWALHPAAGAPLLCLCRAVRGIMGLSHYNPDSLQTVNGIWMNLSLRSRQPYVSLTPLYQAGN